MRQIVAVLVLALFTLSAPAAPTDRPQTPPVDKNQMGEKAKRPPDQFQMTPETEVRLDERSCKYEDVPEGAVIVRLDVGPDRRTIVRVFFKSGDK